MVGTNSKPRAEKGLQTEDEYQKVADHLAYQIGEDLMADILTSEEYRRCVNVNAKVFDLVDSAKADTVKASVVHNFNHERYLAKVALQRKFFPSTSITEKKN